MAKPEVSEAPPPGNAEPQLGNSGDGHAESAHRGWHSRGYLPHADHPGVLQAITYHLGDSLPRNVVEEIKEELARLPLKSRGRELRKRLETLLDAGYGCCCLKDPRAAGLVVDTWRRFACERYDLIAWVVMPNHTHVLIRVYEGQPLEKILQSWKSYTGRRIAELPFRGSSTTR